MTSLRVHFDGRVLVPEGPVDLPRGRTLEVFVREVENSPVGKSIDDFIDIHPDTGLPVFRVPKGTRIVTSEDVKAAEDDYYT